MAASAAMLKTIFVMRFMEILLINLNFFVMLLGKNRAVQPFSDQENAIPQVQILREHDGWSYKRDRFEPL